MENKYHTPVLLEEAISSLNIKPNGRYVDCTLGGGGHSSAIAKKLSDKGELISLDHDIEAIQFVEGFYSSEVSDSNWKIMKSNFSKMGDLFEEDSIDGILMDLGISSSHIDKPSRGFSYYNDSDPLDMRMDKDLGVSASDLINVLDERELTQLFFTYGEEKYSKRIAKAIKEYPDSIKTVGDLISAISRVVPAANSDRTKTKRIFQALRIAVNDELNSLKDGLNSSIPLLRKNGRLVVISFHSLEDRIVKEHFLNSREKGDIEILTKKPITASDFELDQNSRSKSAKMRVAQRI